jgi:hypothetical protein
MPSTQEALRDLDAWSAVSNDEREAVARSIASSLGARFEADATLRGTHRLASVRHRATGLPLVAVPGQSFEMGMTDDERGEVLALAEPAAHALLRTQLDLAQPRRRVRIAPFLCATVPVLETMVPALVARWNAAMRPEFSGAGAVPCHVTAAEARTLRAEFAFRFLSESEWECVAREATSARWLGGRAPAADADASESIRLIAVSPAREAAKDEPSH